jgi:drug/metabolite transporter (DMT)-like permease
MAVPEASGPERTASQVLAGIGLMLAGVALFSCVDALGKFIVATYSVGQLLWLRSCSAFVFMAPVIWRQRAAYARLERPWLQLLRVAFSTTDVFLFFLATAYLPLADVITFYLAAPIYVTAASGLVLGERVGWRRWSAVAVGFIGVLVALQPSTRAIGWPSLIALGGSFSFAAMLVMTRLLRATPDIVLASSQFTGSFLVGGALTPLGWITPTPRDAVFFLLAGGISVGALLCTNRSLKLAPASVVVPYQYTMIIWAVIFGYAVFGDLPTPATLMGAAVIIGAGFYIFVRERKLGTAAAMVEPPPG